MGSIDIAIKAIEEAVQNGDAFNNDETRENAAKALQYIKKGLHAPVLDLLEQNRSEERREKESSGKFFWRKAYEKFHVACYEIDEWTNPQIDLLMNTKQEYEFTMNEDLEKYCKKSGVKLVKAPFYTMPVYGKPGLLSVEGPNRRDWGTLRLDRDGLTITEILGPNGKPYADTYRGGQEKNFRERYLNGVRKELEKRLVMVGFLRVDHPARVQVDGLVLLDFVRTKLGPEQMEIFRSRFCDCARQQEGDEG